ncbi:TPA: hypothetical protein ACH1J3_002228 [Citrobacter werkmanii]
MGRLKSIKDLLAFSNTPLTLIDSKVSVELPMNQTVYNSASVCAEQNLISPVFSFYFKNQCHDKKFCLWANLPPQIINGSITHFIITLELQELRHQGVKIYFDEKELVKLERLAPERYLILSLGINNNECTICPDDYAKNEIARYGQVKTIWNLLCSCADHQNGTHLIFLYKQKLTIELKYDWSDLESDFDGFSKFESIFLDELNTEAKTNILKSTLHSFLRKERSNEAFSKLLSRFTLFSQLFEENFRSFSVGFSFDKIRKEYSEKFRDYLSKLNGIMYDTLTRSLSIPISSLISFVAMKGGVPGNELIINVGAMLLIVFASINIHYLVKFQISMVDISKAEYKELFESIRTELSGLELAELGNKEHTLDNQSGMVKSVLRFVYAISLCNLILNSALFTISTF